MSERRVPKVCEQCSVEVAGKRSQRFCSRSCSVTNTNEARKANPLPLAGACTAGHSFTEANTYLTKDGRRICRECKRLRERDARRKAGKRPSVKAVPPPSQTPPPQTPAVARTEPVLTWRPSAPGWSLRPGDKGYDERQEAS